ncbi:hypothetical protein DSO57_1024385 [Entomophthora muscae]|uniref:Uncharacterized protein n=1 Tax=Entomophthora muscae TaxID=34485 RepID=A0ACC2TQ34_9FUNG|nr:hypothetical protein DSO57_1024385 [Entomophthora muscae]
MSQNTISYLNDPDDFGGYSKIMVVLPLHRADEKAEYYAYVHSTQTVLDLKELVKSQLASQPPSNKQRVIYRGKVLSDSAILGPLLTETSEELPHFHVVVNNSSARLPYNGRASSSNTTPQPIQTTVSAPSAQSTNLPPPAYVEDEFFRNTSLPLSQNSLRNYMEAIREGTAELSTLPIVNHPIYYQFVTINGRAYLITSREVHKGLELRRCKLIFGPYILGLGKNAHNLWPSVWLAIKLLFFYAILSNGTSLYKKVLFGAIAILIFAFQHGVIDIQIEVIRNQPPEANNPPIPEQTPLNERPNQEEAQGNDGTRQSSATSTSFFFLSFFPAREVADNPQRN